MQAYPAYTIDKIEDELSLRMVKELLGCWDDDLPVSLRIDRIEQVLCKAYGVKFEKKTQTDDQLIDTFRNLGWL